MRSTVKSLLPNWLDEFIRWAGNARRRYVYRSLGKRAKDFRLTCKLPSMVERSLSGGIAVVMPCFGHAVYLPKALESVARQTRRPFELVCVDDCSSDNTFAILQEFKRTAPTGIAVTVLRNEGNRGQARTLNRAIEAAHASVITVLNDDDYLLYDVLEATMAVLTNVPTAMLVGASAVHFRSPDELERIIASGATIRRGVDYSTLPLVHHSPADAVGWRHPNDVNMTHSGMSVLKAAWRAVGGYWPRKKRLVEFSDRDFQMRVASCFPIVLTTTPFALWRSTSSVDSGINS